MPQTLARPTKKKKIPYERFRVGTPALNSNRFPVTKNNVILLPLLVLLLLGAAAPRRGCFCTPPTHMRGLSGGVRYFFPWYRVCSPFPTKQRRHIWKGTILPHLSCQGVMRSALDTAVSEERLGYSDRHADHGP